MNWAKNEETKSGMAGGGGGRGDGHGGRGDGL